ncbi:MAG: hypothetical protein IT395_03065 [Candidatus Omnitrophica bacterium]|nr:hypothetical protein [Candidatus Omnitrophota bacterium]
MWLFLGILFLFGGLHTVNNISLINKRRYQLICCAFISAAAFILFPILTKINIQAVDRGLSDFNVLSMVCTFQVFESMAAMLISLLLIKNHYNGQNRMRIHYLALLPSGVFLAGLSLIQMYLFHGIEGIHFVWIALGFAGSLFVILGLSVAVLNKLERVWEWKIESKIILAFLQILLAMFLPLIIVGMNIGESHFKIYFGQTLATFLFMLGLVGTGFLWQMHLEEKGKIT